MDYIHEDSLLVAILNYVCFRLQLLDADINWEGKVVLEAAKQMGRKII